MWDPTTKTTKVPMLPWHYITRVVLYTGPDGGLINLKHVTYASETEYVCRPPT